MNTFAVIPMRDQWSYTRDLVAQLVAQDETDEIIICDNGSIEIDSRDYLRGIAGTATVLPCWGYNLHEMWNLGIARAKHRDDQPDVALLNNDLRIGPNFMASLARALRAHERVWAVCPNYDDREMAAGMVQVHDVCAGKYDGTGGFSGFAFMVKGELFGSTVPWFDEDLQWFFGDNDFYETVDSRGGTIAMVGAATVEHLDGGSRTVHAHLDETRPAFKADRARFEEKWGWKFRSAAARSCRSG